MITGSSRSRRRAADSTRPQALQELVLSDTKQPADRGLFSVAIPAHAHERRSERLGREIKRQLRVGNALTQIADHDVQMPAIERRERVAIAGSGREQQLVIVNPTHAPILRDRPKLRQTTLARSRQARGLKR